MYEGSCSGDSFDDGQTEGKWAQECRAWFSQPEAVAARASGTDTGNKSPRFSAIFNGGDSAVVFEVLQWMPLDAVKYRAPFSVDEFLARTIQSECMLGKSESGGR